MVAIAERRGRISVPCYEQYEASVRSFFVNYPDISVYTLPHRIGWDWGSPPDRVYDEAIVSNGFSLENQIRLGVYAGQGIVWDFTKSFYEHAGLDYSARWDKSPIREAAKSLEQFEWAPGIPKVFVHDDPVRGFRIYKSISPEHSNPRPIQNPSSILHYAKIIEEADEIHVIDSAFFWLVNALKPRGKLYLHCYARWPRPRSFRYDSKQDWNYVF